MTFTDLIYPGVLVTTSYDTGPYLVTKVSGPCRCCHPNDWHKETPLPEHFHMHCCDPEDKRDKYYLGYYALVDGKIKSVIHQDEIFLGGHKKGFQGELVI